MEQYPRRTTYNTRLSKGVDWNPVFVWKDEDGVLVNLTDFSAELRIGSDSTNGNSTNYFTLTDSAGLTLGGSAGTISVLLEAAITATIEWEWAEYDLDVTDSLGNKTRLLHGKIYADNAVG